MADAGRAPEGDRWERAGRRIVHWAVLGIVVTVTYCWCVRISDDLNWDEAASFRKYAHNPITAGAYMHDSNNHPGESLFRSVFFGILGLDSPAFHRFAGFLILLGFLAAAWKWDRFLTQRGSTFAATILALLLFQSHAIHDQALVLRGYFPTIVLEVVYFLLVARWSGMLDQSDEPPTAMTRSVRWKLAALSGLMLFVLPSNVGLMAVIWPATAMAFGPAQSPAASRISHVARETAKLGLQGSACAAVLYLPIFITLALWKPYDRDALPIYPVVDVTRLAAIRDEVLLVIQQVQPGPFGEILTGQYHRHPVSAGSLADWVFALPAGALVLASVLLRRGARGTQVAWCLILTTLVSCAAFAAFNETPPRIRAPFVAPLILAVAFMAHDLAGSWRPRVQILASCMALCVGYAALVAPVRATAFDRRASDMAAFLETYTRPTERHVLVLHGRQQNLRPYLHRVFGDDWTIDDRPEIAQRLSGKPIPERSAGAIERWVTDHLVPVPAVRPIRPDDVEVVVLIGAKETTRGGAIDWDEPALDAIKKRLNRVSHFRRDSRDIEIYERP